MGLGWSSEIPVPALYKVGGAGVGWRIGGWGGAINTPTGVLGSGVN